MRRFFAWLPALVIFIYGILGHLDDGKVWLKMWQSLASLDWQWWNFILLFLSIMLALYATFPQAAIDGLRTKVFGVRTPITKPEAETDDPQGTDYLGACSIVEAYIQHGIIDMRPGVALTVRYGILERFKNSPGAMLSEGVYNEKLLHFWMQSNAAKLLVKNRGDL